MVELFYFCNANHANLESKRLGDKVKPLKYGQRSNHINGEVLSEPNRVEKKTYRCHCVFNFSGKVCAPKRPFRPSRKISLLANYIYAYNRTCSHCSKSYFVLFGGFSELFSSRSLFRLEVYSVSK